MDPCIAKTTTEHGVTVSLAQTPTFDEVEIELSAPGAAPVIVGQVYDAGAEGSALRFPFLSPEAMLRPSTLRAIADLIDLHARAR